MEIILNYLKEVLEYLPKEVIISVFVVIFLTELTKNLFSKLENYFETKKGKEIKFFNHTKIIFSILWSAITCVLLVVAKVYTWNKLPMYFFVVLGASGFFYDLVVKKYKNWKKDE